MIWKLIFRNLMTSVIDSDFSQDTSRNTVSSTSCSTLSSHEHDVRKLAQDLISLLEDDQCELYNRTKKYIKKFKDQAREIFTIDIDGWTPFHAVTLRGQKKTIKLMLNSGVDVNHRMTSPTSLPGDCTPLHVAAYRGDTKVIKCILSRGAFVNVRNAAGLPPIYYAMARENIEVANILLGFGADITGLTTTEPDASERNRIQKSSRPILGISTPKIFKRMFNGGSSKS